MSNYGLIAQGLSIVVLVLLFIYVIKKYSFKRNTKEMAIAALLITLSVILNAISISFGEVFKISLVYLPLMLAGCVLSPSYAYLVGLCMDFIGLIITPTSYPFFGFTLNHVLASTLPALWYQSAKDISAKLINNIINFILLGLAIVASIYIFISDSASINGSTLTFTLPIKVGCTLFLIVMSLIIIFIIKLVRKKLSDEEANELCKWMAVAVVIEVLVNIFLTPIWLDVMYSVPFMVSLFLRIVKATVMIPINIILGYSLVKVLKRLR